MDYEKLDEIAGKLEDKFIPESAKGNLEAKEILSFTSFYRIERAKAESKNENGGLHLQNVTHRVCANCYHINRISAEKQVCSLNVLPIKNIYRHNCNVFTTPDSFNAEHGG